MKHDNLNTEEFLKSLNDDERQRLTSAVRIFSKWLLERKEKRRRKNAETKRI